MEVYILFCRDNHSPDGISEITVQGDSKESIIEWWDERGFNKVLPAMSIQLKKND